jgi:hypothetical protein
MKIQNLKIGILFLGIGLALNSQLKWPGHLPYLNQIRTVLLF